LIDPLFFIGGGSEIWTFLQIVCASLSVTKSRGVPTWFWGVGAGYP